MKVLFIFAALFLLQSFNCQETGVTDKKCEDFLPATTCTNLRNVAQLLHEKASIVHEAVKAAIAHHKTKASEMLAYIKEYMAQNMQCEKVLNADMCAKINALGQRVKLTTLQVKEAIENAVAAGKTKVTDIYNQAVQFMTTQITCANIFSQVTCDNMRSAIKKFHEQVGLLNEAIMSAAQKHYTTVTEMLKSVKNTIVEKAVNFKCVDVLPDTTCQKLKDLGTKLHLTAQQVRTAIEEAVVNGAVKAKDIYNQTITFLTTQVNCKNILGETACTNLVEAAKRLHEQTILIKEAIVAAVLKHANNARDILTSVKDTLVQKAKDFKCTDALSQGQCDFLTNLAAKFKLQAGELHRVLVESIVNGTRSAKQLYDVTIGKFVEDAKNLKCEDLISKDTCDKLDAFAKNFHIKLSQVTLAVKEAIAHGATSVAAVYKSAMDFLKEKLSCDNFLGESACNKLESLANALHVNFKKVTDKMRELVSNGVSSVTDIYKKVVAYMWNLFWGDANKRSLDMVSMTDRIMDLVEKVISVGKDVKEKLKAEIKKAVEQGKVTLFKITSFVKELIAKYGPQSDEDAVSVYQSLIDQLKAALKNAHGAAKRRIEELLVKSKDALVKLQEYIKSILGDSDAASDSVRITYDIIADIARKELDDEFKMAEDEVENMVYEQL